MTELKTELASVEEHDNAVRKAIERRAYTLADPILTAVDDNSLPGNKCSVVAC